MTKLRVLLRRLVGRPAPRLRYQPVEEAVRRAPEQTRLTNRGERR